MLNPYQTSAYVSRCSRTRLRVSSVTQIAKGRVTRPLRQPIYAVEQQDKKEKAPPSPPSPNNDKEGRPKARLDEVLEDLKKSGMTTAKATKLLNAWSKIGVNDPKQLRKMLVQRALTPLTATLLQAVIDGTLSLTGFYIGILASQSEGFQFRFLFEIIGNFAGIYYFINVLLQLSVAGAIVYSTFRFGTSSAEVLAAVQQLAGPSSGVGIVDKATTVVNTIKVLQALEECAKLMQELYGEAQTSSGTAKDSLKNLSALLTLKRAKEELGFQPEQYGLSEKQAANIALAFSVFDLNDNGRLELSEIGSLCSSLGSSLDDAELKEALKTLDKDKNGYVDFIEFVDWWCINRMCTIKPGKDQSA